eukprot:scaffold45829_cov44-Prasinocladus_malaysianus.AAC.1
MQSSKSPRATAIRSRGVLTRQTTHTWTTNWRSRNNATQHFYGGVPLMSSISNEKFLLQYSRDYIGEKENVRCECINWLLLSGLLLTVIAVAGALPKLLYLVLFARVMARSVLCGNLTFRHHVRHGCGHGTFRARNDAPVPTPALQLSSSKGIRR